VAARVERDPAFARAISPTIFGVMRSALNVDIEINAWRPPDGGRHVKSGLDLWLNREP